MNILTETPEDCLKGMLRDAVRHIAAACPDAPPGKACGRCGARIQAYRDLAAGLGLQGATSGLGSGQGNGYA